jgi:hypothetical protein
MDKRKKVCYMQLAGLFSSLFGKEERGQEHAAAATPKEEPPPSLPPPLSLYLYLLLNEVGYLGAGQRLSLSSFWVILDWFLF